MQLADQENWAPGWVFDGRKNIYAPFEFRAAQRHRFLSQDEQSYEVRTWETRTCDAAPVSVQAVYQWQNHYKPGCPHVRHAVTAAGSTMWAAFNNQS